MTAKNMMRLIIDFITRSIVKYGFKSIDLHGAAGLENEREKETETESERLKECRGFAYLATQ